MGYMRHHAIIVTTWDHNKIKAARDEAIRYGNICTEICASGINGYQTFLVVPDGSKEGWADSDAGDLDRANFRRWLREESYQDRSNPYDWAEIMYGDDDGEFSIRGAR